MFCSDSVLWHSNDTTHAQTYTHTHTHRGIVDYFGRGHSCPYLLRLMVGLQCNEGGVTFAATITKKFLLMENSPKCVWWLTYIYMYIYATTIGCLLLLWPWEQLLRIGNSSNQRAEWVSVNVCRMFRKLSISWTKHTHMHTFLMPSGLRSWRS